MASLPTRTTASFFAIQPIPSATPLDDEFNDMKGAAGFLNGGTTAKKLLIKTSDATDPPVDCDQVGAGLLARWKQNTTTKVSLSNAGLFTMVNTGVNPGLNADQVDGIEGANIAKLDTHKTAFSVTFGYVAIPSAVETVESVFRYIVPPGQDITVTQIWFTWAAGSDSLAANVFTVKRRNSAGTLQTDLGTVDINSASQNVIGVNNITDTPLVAGDQLYALLTTRNAPASEQMINIALIGTQKFTT